MPISLDALVIKTVLKENNHNIDAAFSDLAGRYVQMCALLDRAERLYSRAFAREGKPTQGSVDDPVNPITDDWIQTGKDTEGA